MRINSFVRVFTSSFLAVAVLANIAACGGGEDDSVDSASASLAGGWYSSKTLAVWNFFEGSTANSGTGQLFQGSFDGTACRITLIRYAANSAASTFTYTITRAIGAGVDNTYDSGSISQGPYTEPYKVSNSSATIGNATYAEVSTSFRPAGCQGQ